MPRYNRSGRNVQTIALGKVMCLRQELMHPGEIIDSSVQGRVRLAAMREQEGLPVHVHLEGFVTPLRWLQTNWDTYVKEGPSTSESLGPAAHPTALGDYLGVGFVVSPDVVWHVFLANYLRVYNEYFKWPEDADSTTVGKANHKYGLPAVNLPSRWTRFISQDSISADETELTTVASGSREKFDIRDLAEKIARFRHEQEQEWSSSGRYKEFLQTAWGASGVNEVDEVPYSLGYENGTMSAANLWATDADGIGEVAGIYEFDIGHSFGKIFAPEASIVSYFLVIRSLPVLEDQSNPFLALDDKTWAEITGHPGLLAKQRPKKWKERDIQQALDTTTDLGYVPAGQEWRVGWDNVSRDIAVRESFMTMPDSAIDNWKYHPPADQAFRSSSLGQGIVHLYFRQMSNSRIPLPMASVMAGG